MRAERDRLATALADAFLSGPWEPEAMRTAASRVLQSRHRWARRLVDEVLGVPTAAAGPSPRSGCVCSAQHHDGRGGASVEPAAPPLAGAVALDHRTDHYGPFPVQPIDHGGELAEMLDLTMPELLWFADTKGLQRRSSSDRLHHYRSRWVAKPAGGARLLEAPLPASGSCNGTFHSAFSCRYRCISPPMVLSRVVRFGPERNYMWVPRSSSVWIWNLSSRRSRRVGYTESSAARAIRSRWRIC